MARPIIAWSFSAIQTYENCPYKFWATRVGKIVSDVNKANADGANDHESFEHYVGRNRALPAHLQRFRPALDMLKRADGEILVEQQYALDQSYAPCGFKDWNAAWVRVISDYLCINGQVARMVDYKFGKPHKDADQNSLVAAVLFQTYPQLQQIKTVYWYANHDKVVPFDFTRQDTTKIWNRFLPTVNKMTQAKLKDEWPKTPNPLCAWCPVSTCVHNTNPAFKKPE